ncbi:MAG TPA: hypothetical protein PLN83_01830 [Syntrophorhabdus sp.]|jgi:hypothetical protein|nr:hypothetical protein [Syntrophorhabdus sp.]
MRRNLTTSFPIHFTKISCGAAVIGNYIGLAPHRFRVGIEGSSEIAIRVFSACAKSRVEHSPRALAYVRGLTGVRERVENPFRRAFELGGFASIS